MFLMIFVNMAAIVGRLSITALIEPLGRRGSGTIYCVLAAVLMVLGRLPHDVYVVGASLFYILIVAQELLRQRRLHRRRAVHGGDLAGPAARQRHGPQLRRRQLRQVHRPARAGADHGRGRSDQARRAQPRHARPGAELLRRVVPSSA